MLFAIGTKVKFLHTGDEGIVKSRLEKGMVSVYLPNDDMEIPAAEEDLIRAEDVRKNPVKAKIVEGKKEKPAPAPPPFVKIETQYTILRSIGLQLAFLPVENSEGIPEKFIIYLLNDTKYDVIFDLRFWLNYRKSNWNDRLPATSYMELGEMLYDDLNEAPEFDCQVQWVTTEGLGEPLSKSLKIKPKTFFSTMRTAPLLNKPTYHFRLFENVQFEAEKDTAEDLAAYTKRHAKPAWQLPGNRPVSSIADTQELATFNREIDLHIEVLRENPHKLTNSEILAIQLEAFEKFIAKAIRLGVPSVFVIHGVGKGRLKDEIATRLFNNPDVMTFKNEYHHKYGWGATEVIL